MKFTIKKHATSVIIYPGKQAMESLAPLLELHTFDDEYQDVTKVMGYMYDSNYDELYFHKGVDIAYIRRLLINTKTIDEPYHPYKPMKFDFEEILPPRDEEQRDCINFIAGIENHQENINDSQLFVVLSTGAGKTFCAGYGAGLYGAKTLIIMHRDNLRTQWVKSLYELNGYSSKYVHEIDSSTEFEAICRNQHDFDYDVYLITHATFRAGCKRVQDAHMISDFTKNLGIGLKIIDEAHLEFNDTLMIDFLFNVKRNLYLTATDGRSQRSEDAIFKYVFRNTAFYRRERSALSHPAKWVEYITVNIDTHVKRAVYQFRVNRGKGMSAVTYGKFVIGMDKSKTHFRVCRELVRDIFINQPSSKVLVFMPLIDLCIDCAYMISKLNYDKSFDYDISVKTVHSHNSVTENEINKQSDVIVTTIQSLGTGSDIKGVTDIICCTPMVSRIVVQQVLGRIRYINKKCHYYDIIDNSVPADMYWWKSRSKTLSKLCISSNSITWVDTKEEAENGINEQ